MVLKLSGRRCGWLSKGENGMWVQRIKGRGSVVLRHEAHGDKYVDKAGNGWRKLPFRPAFVRMCPKG